MNIGELAQLTGVTTDAVRFYEREGLLKRPARSANGYRRFDDADVERLRFVRAAQALGFSLAEIGRLLPRLALGAMDRREIRSHLDAKISEIDAQMRRLRALRQELVHTRETLPCAPERNLKVADVMPKLRRTSAVGKPARRRSPTV